MHAPARASSPASGAARALITGCSSGIGRATAVELTRRGYDVVATARRPEALADLDVTERLALDVTDEASMAAAVDAAGDVDVLVNNAGISLRSPIEKVPMEAVRSLFETNVFGPLRLMQLVLPGMRERRRGAIVNVSSASGVVSTPIRGLYSSTKFALEALGEALLIEAGHWGIRSILIEPGFIATSIDASLARYGTDEPPYEELNRQLEAGLGGRIEGAPGPELVATTIADAIETDAPKLRWPVGADAELVTAARADMDDEALEATLRQYAKLDW